VFPTSRRDEASARQQCGKHTRRLSRGTSAIGLFSRPDTFVILRSIFNPASRTLADLTQTESLGSWPRLASLVLLVPPMPEHFLVVGGTTGTGRVVVRAIAAAGHHITVLGRHEPPEALLGEQVHIDLVDLRDTAGLRDAADRAIARHQTLNHLIFCQRYRDAGDSWQGELETSLTATKTLVEACAPSFRRQRNHALVAIGSSATTFIAPEQAVGYHAAKAALAQMMRFYAEKLGPLGVRANVVSPALLLKDESRQALEADPGLVSLYEAITPLNRLGRPEDVAHLILFLCSSAASFITGQDIAVDGGISLTAQASIARRWLRSAQPPNPGPS
jgi:gluconate 5-dehydrogenase